MRDFVSTRGPGLGDQHVESGLYDPLQRRGALGGGTRALYIAIMIAQYMAMKMANIADFKNRISEYLSAVEGGEEIEVRKRNVPIARVVPIPRVMTNRTVLGVGKGTGRIVGDATRPFIPEREWGTLREKRR